jgi:hypothetical protein
MERGDGPWRERHPFTIRGAPSGARCLPYCCHTVRLEFPLLWNPSVAMIW